MLFRKEENNFRSYKIDDSCIFKKNEDEFGGLSNMSTSFIINVNGIKTTSTEAIYQACKFPDNIDLQKEILYERSPFIAKNIAKKGIEREDWLSIRVNVMRWCVQIKLAQNYYSFGDLLRKTGNKNIVEFSTKDQFWGAKKINDYELSGKNALGRLLMELRQNYYSQPLEKNLLVLPPDIKNFKLLGKQIEHINMISKYSR